ncbi:MAG TPA: SprT family zinc-dependent metalloprotease [Candidatus Limnocylindrales bacterium]|nr:SprT family zinc-dependent metalloprotease [Candidatus Limnocylindrales bacterium]
MSQKKLVVAGIGEVIFQKRKGSRTIRLTIGHEGQVRVSMPTWSPYNAGEAFVLSKTEWIKKHQSAKPINLFGMHDRIGKAHRLRFIPEPRNNTTSRVTKTEIIIRLPIGARPSDNTVQKIVRAAAVRALKQEAKQLLPHRLHSLAIQFGFQYRSVAIKQLKTRWGSCSSAKDIALNCYLMQLPWDLIDYVLLHELLHTQIMAHGKPFWNELGQYVKGLPSKRQAMRSYQPSLIAAI